MPRQDKNREETTCWVDDVTAAELRRFFVRLAPMGDDVGSRVKDTIDVEASVDYDAEGEVMGINVWLPTNLAE